MAKVIFAPILLLVLTSPWLTQGENLQSWSHHVYKDEPYTLSCETDEVAITPADVITWTRHGHDGQLTTDDHFEIRAKGGIPNADLLVKSVTDDTKGIYVCHIHGGSSNMLLGSVVRGINVGKHRYHDNMDKYRENVIVGIIAAASVLVFIIAIGAISHYRYLSEESLEKRRVRKEERLRKKQARNGGGVQNSAHENHGADLGQKEGETAGGDTFVRL